MSFFTTFKREFSLVFERTGLMILLFIGPVFLSLYFGGVYYNDYVKDIPVAILDEDQSTLSNTINDAFSSNERFDVTHYPKSRQELQSLIDTGVVQLGIWIPQNFQNDVTTYTSSEVLLLSDGTNLVVSNNAYAQAVAITKTISTGIEMKLIQGQGVSPDISMKMAQPFQIKDRVLYDPKMTYMNYLIICFLAVFLQQLFISGMGVMLIWDKEYILSKNPIQNIIAVVSVVIIGLIPSAFASYLVLKNWFHVPIVGDMKLILFMTLIFLLSLSGPALCLAALTNDRSKYSQIAFMFSLPTFVSSGCVWPLYLMPKTLVNIIHVFWPLINFAKPAQEIIVKGRDYPSVLSNIQGMAIYGIIWFIIGVFLYTRTLKTKPILIEK